MKSMDLRMARGRHMVINNSAELAGENAEWHIWNKGKFWFNDACGAKLHVQFWG